MLKKQNCVIWIHTFIIYKKTNYIYKDIAEDVETRYNTSSYELNSRYLKEKQKK